MRVSSGITGFARYDDFPESTCLSFLLDPGGKRHAQELMSGFIGMFISYCFVMGLAAGYANTGNSQMGVAVIPFLFFFVSTLI